MSFVDHGGDPLTLLEPSAKTRKPRTRLTKWLAKIAGVYDGEMTPKTEAEYYLNEIAENGGGGGAFFVTDNNNTLDKTWAEISAASENSVVVLIKKDYGFGYLTHVIHTESPTDYSCTFMFPVQNQGKLGISFLSYDTSAENDYPAKEHK